MNRRTLSRRTTLLCLLALPMLVAPSREVPFCNSKVGTESPLALLPQSDAPIRARLSAAYSQLPLSFEANEGQTDRRVKFLSRGSGDTYT
jgi:hypothetical protein